MRLRHFIHAIFLTAAASASAQNDTITKAKPLDEVVITGQYNAQSVRKSVYQVTVISRADIDRQAGNNLADVLNQTLNINITPNRDSGKSGVSLFGLGGDYFKILVDNIPIINDESLGNNTDLTQINLDDIEQIEIVEGSMGVEYGANAVSGIINIITKKGSKYKWEITPYIQEETISDEYNVSDQGRHIQSVKIGHNFNSRWYANAVLTVNDFKGFFNDKKGEKYFENDSLRGYDWNPKKQLTAKSLLAYNLNNHRIFYKFEYFAEDVERYNSVVIPNYNPATETSDPTARDRMYGTQRFFHNLNATGRFESLMNYDVSLSFQQQKREIESYNYRIRADEKFDREKFNYESQDGLYSKGNFSNFLDNETLDFQAGYEASQIEGYSQSIAGEMQRSSIKRTLGSYDVFASSEINVTKKFSVRPGIRGLFSSKFDAQAALSLSAKYAFDNGYELRTVVGTSPKLPSYDELYTFFVDVNHNVQGNENLKPEQGISAFVHLNKTFANASGLQVKNKFSVWYMDVKDRIELVIVNPTPLAYKYENIDLFRTWGTSFASTAAYNNLTVGAGITCSGISMVINSDEAYNNDDYLYGVQANANASYLIPKWATVFSVFAKYNGPQYQFVGVYEGTDVIYVKGKQEDYSMIDASVKKSLFSNNFEVTVGARNLLDVTDVRTTASQGGVHNAPASTDIMGYGRSYFLKLLYKFNY